MEIKVPTHINDITVAEFKKFSSIKFDEQDDDFAAFKMIEIFCGVPLKTVSQFPLKDAEDIVSQIRGVLEQKTEFKDRFEIDGVEYGFIPKLEDMTLGEFINLEDYLKDTKYLNRAASILYRPVTKKFGELYDIEPYLAEKSYWDVMEKAPIGIISEAVVFFYRLGSELLIATNHYLGEAEVEKTIILEKLNLLLNLDGLIPSTLWQMATSQNTNK